MEGNVILGVGIVIVVIVGVFLYESGRKIYYWIAAKLHGWSEAERFERETAWLDREFERVQRLADRDAKAAADADRRRIGVGLASVSVLVLAFQGGLPWWQAVLIGAAMYAGLTMAAGLAWKWW